MNRTFLVTKTQHGQRADLGSLAADRFIWTELPPLVRATQPIQAGRFG